MFRELEVAAFASLLCRKDESGTTHLDDRGGPQESSFFRHLAPNPGKNSSNVHIILSYFDCEIRFEVQWLWKAIGKYLCRK